MKSRLVPTIYRIFMILTFLCGSVMMHFLIRLVIHNLDMLNVTDAKVTTALHGLGYSYFVFIIMLLISVILSLICFRAAKPIASIVRTFSTVLAVAFCIPAIEFMLQCTGVLAETVKSEKFDLTGVFILTADTYQVFLPMPAFTIVTILLITSVIALVQGPRMLEDEEENNEEEAEGKEQTDGKKKKKKKGKKGAPAQRQRMSDTPEEAAAPQGEKTDEKKKAKK